MLSTQRKKVVALFASSIIGLVMGMLISVVNTRVISTSQYGDVRYVQNLIGFFSSLLMFGYFVSGSRLLALSEDEMYRRRIRGAMCLILSICAVILAFLLLCTYAWAGIEDKSYTFLLLAVIPVSGNALMLSYINTTAQGDNHIGRISCARLLPSILYLVLAYEIYAYFKATPLLMLLLYNGVSVIALIIIIISTKPVFRDIEGSLKILNAENKKYGRDTYIGSLISVSTGYLSGITLGIFNDDNSTVGFYTLAVTLSAPLAMLPSIIGTTYFRQFANQYRISRKVIFGSCFITCISLLLFSFLISYIVRFLYNEEYSVVSEIAIYLALGTAVHGIGDIFNRFLGAHGRGRELRISATIYGCITIIGSSLLVYFLNIDGAIITRVVASIAYCLTLVTFYKRFQTGKHV